ncbi:adenylate kinase family enzyme [Georgenia muralis]|uniref:Adenylate kinase family enzyme n=1 Tax=Georgenia muralis TaxID=154117 RepID=A0A3N4ZLG1_9MICO|nr:AAA family ATPase [Georgenia muralis]RPF26522.1 adenylate kinase family enzyme [Georgenia muralis]
MPLLGPAHPLPARPARVLVAGTSGAGKTSTARRIAERLGVQHVEIDALYHGPGWTPRPTFEADVQRFVAEPSWVTEWQYASVRAALAERADLLVWVDLPRARVMQQVVVRTVVRRRRRQELWNGNVEPPLWTILTDREHIVRWAWTTHRKTAARVADLRRRRPDLPVVRLRSWPEIEHWISGPMTRLPAGGASGRGATDLAT